MKSERKIIKILLAKNRLASACFQLIFSMKITEFSSSPSLAAMRIDNSSWREPNRYVKVIKIDFTIKQIIIRCKNNSY